MDEFRPRIIAFLCNWCAYAGADLAGVSRIQYQPNIRVVRVMCSGRVDPITVVRAFSVGIDGVMVLGCHPGDCHYLTGNYLAERKMKLLKKILDKAGIGRERLCAEWVSAAEGARFAQLVSNFTEQIRGLGPIGQIENSKEKLAIVKGMVENVRLRWLVGRVLKLVEQANVYGEKLEQEKMDEIMERNVDDLYVMGKILSLIKENPLSVKEIAEKLNLPLRNAFWYMVKGEDRELAKFVDFKDNSPRYLAVGGGVNK